MAHTEQADARRPPEAGPGEGPEERGHGWNSGLTLTTAAFLFLLLRLFAVSGYHWHTAFAVLHTIDIDDAVGIVLGTVMADSVVAAVLLAVLLPAFLFRVLGGFMMAVRMRRRVVDRPPDAHEQPAGARSPVDLAGLVLLAIVVAGVTAYILTFRAWWLLLAIVLVGAAMVGFLALARRSQGQVGQASRWAGRNFGALVAAAGILAMLLSAALVRTPWMPLERIEVGDGQAPLVGYVLEAEPGFLKVMTDVDRHFLILRDADVESREEIEN
ncbi:hypothetical protein ACIQM4_16615 [Streptomyces sp. NPDC091272]|uniref:hypothetical protein n=1 Tax=Streptomyces sp. NPDC091272 TaxID=3365981 RepID=UPI00382D868E